MIEYKAQRSILILPSTSKTRTISPQAIKGIEVYASKGYIIEYFNEQELIVNITQHILVPEHT
jgi:hypothetical protein